MSAPRKTRSRTRTRQFSRRKVGTGERRSAFYNNRARFRRGAPAFFKYIRRRLVHYSITDRLSGQDTCRPNGELPHYYSAETYQSFEQIYSSFECSFRGASLENGRMRRARPFLKCNINA